MLKTSKQYKANKTAGKGFGLRKGVMKILLYLTLDKALKLLYAYMYIQ